MIEGIMLKRREAREAAFSLIYEAGYCDGDYAGQFELSREVREIEIDDYITAAYRGVTGHLAELDKLISDCALNWKTGRISRVTMAILRLCAYEMLYMEDVPYTVAINEAVELAKKYDDDKAPAFVNGVANRIAEEKGLKKEEPSRG